MLTETDDALSDLEKKMLDAVDRAYGDWEENPDAPLPMSLVALMSKTHTAILARLSKRAGMDLSQMMKNPEAGLAMLDRMKMMLLRMMEQRTVKVLSDERRPDV